VTRRIRFEEYTLIILSLAFMTRGKAVGRKSKSALLEGEWEKEGRREY
jgi:hypothetical protein